MLEDNGRVEGKARSIGSANSLDACDDFHNSISKTKAIEFNEEIYLKVFDDVIVSIDLGEFKTGKEHYEAHGIHEGRLTDERYISAFGLGASGPCKQSAGPFSIDSILCSQGGFALVVGWVDDRSSPLTSISLFSGDGRGWNTTAFGRVRREDAETALGSSAVHLFGFWLVVHLDHGVTASRPWTIRGRLANGQFAQSEVAARLLTDSDLRTTILSFFAGIQYNGNRELESYLSIEAGIGNELIRLNRKITRAVIAGAWVSYYGPERKNFDGSIIVCLFGKLEYFFLQSAFFSMGAGAENFEFIYVSNSPELTESLEKEARICAKVYGLSIVLICLPDNAGFGAANNIGARYARSNRLLITNPDVFPRDNFWARRHTALVENLPSDQTRMFGAPLYYDDGSLMHLGIYFEIDVGISVKHGGISTQRMIRTEHYAKGAPSWSNRFPCPRKVPAVTGAFISTERAWFEKLGGFNEDYLFGHYEDADLSLKSLTSGQPVWIHDFPMWHMEGKGSTKRLEHEGGTLVNRWLFTKLWGQLIVDELSGPTPSSTALQVSAADLAEVGQSKVTPRAAARNSGRGPALKRSSASTSNGKLNGVSAAGTI